MTDEPTPRKYFDVARPGSRAPSPTSRPVISNTPQPDPMVHEPSPYNLHPAAPEPVQAPEPAPTQAPTPAPEPASAPEPPAAPITPAPHEPDPLPASGPMLIDAHHDFKPPKPTKSRAKQLIVVLVLLAVAAVLALGVYPLVRDKIL